MNKTSKCSVIPTERKPRKTCALVRCNRKHYEAGLCRRHSRMRNKRFVSFLGAGLHLAEFLAKPGVGPVDTKDVDPAANRLARAINHAARHYNSDVERYLRSLFGPPPKKRAA
jgi:hypothetical protein